MYWLKSLTYSEQKEMGLFLSSSLSFSLSFSFFPSVSLNIALSLYLPHITFLHDILEHLELAGRLEGDQVHAPVPTEVPAVEPVPVLE